MSVKLAILISMGLLSSLVNASDTHIRQREAICYLSYTTVHLVGSETEIHTHDAEVRFELEVLRHKNGEFKEMRGIEREVLIANDIYVDFNYIVKAYDSDKNGWRYSPSLMGRFYRWDKTPNGKVALSQGKVLTRLSAGGDRRDTVASLPLQKNIELVQELLNPEFESLSQLINNGKLSDGFPRHFDITCALSI